MEPPRGFLSKLWNFIRFLPYFTGLLIVGFIKGAILCPWNLIVVALGSFALILFYWPMHLFYTCYCICSSKQLGPQLKITLCICVVCTLLVSPMVGLLISALVGGAFGFLHPMFSTFRAVGKPNSFHHILVDGIDETVRAGFTTTRDVKDVLYYSYNSIMEDLRSQGLAGGKYYEISWQYIPVALFVMMIGIPIDFGMIGIIAGYKVFYAVYKGWIRLSQDCIGREGPFLETICVPFAGLAVLCWPFGVCIGFGASVIASVFFGVYSGVVAYQEKSFMMGLRYIVASWSIYDEYSNDVLDLPEGSCYPRPQYRKKTLSNTSSSGSFSRPDSFKKQPLPDTAPVNPLQLTGSLFKSCQHYGELMVSEGVITLKDIEDAKANKDSGQVITIGLPAYCILQTLLRSIKANCAGLLLFDNVTEVIPTNRPKDAFYEWFLNPLLIIKDQIQAQNPSDSEEEYLGKLVLLSGDPERLRRSIIDSRPESERRRAEFEALARRLRGITKSISRFPTYKRRFESSIKIILEQLAKKDGSDDSGPPRIPRSKSMLARMFGDSFNNRTDGTGDHQAQLVDAADKDVENQ